MISAKEARKAVGPTKDDHLDIIETYIKAAIEKKQLETIIRTSPYCTWLYSENMRDNVADAVIAELRELGYTVKLYYQVSQFVDAGLQISWQND